MSSSLVCGRKYTMRDLPLPKFTLLRPSALSVNRDQQMIQFIVIGRLSLTAIQRSIESRRRSCGEAVRVTRSFEDRFEDLVAFTEALT